MRRIAPRRPDGVTASDAWGHCETMDQVAPALFPDEACAHPYWDADELGRWCMSCNRPIPTEDE